MTGHARRRLWAVPIALVVVLVVVVVSGSIRLTGRPAPQAMRADDAPTPVTSVPTTSATPSTPPGPAPTGTAPGVTGTTGSGTTKTGTAGTGTTDTGTADTASAGAAGPGQPSRASSVYPPAPSMTVPADATVYHGASGWQMSVSPTWTTRQITDSDEEAAWWTGGGTAHFLNNINVIVDSANQHMNLSAYVLANVAGLVQQGATVVESGALSNAGHDVGRIQYTGAFGGVKLDAVVYIASLANGWAIATFATAPGAIGEYAPSIEPFLATLQASGI